MGKDTENLIESTLDYARIFFSKYGGRFVFHNFSYIETNVDATREIGKAEGYKRGHYEMGVLAIILKDLGSADTEDTALDNKEIIQAFIEQAAFTASQVDQLNYYIGFLRNGSSSRPGVEEVIRDGADIFLALPDAVERLGLLRMEREDVNGKSYSDVEWLELCSRYWMSREYQTGYAREKYGHRRLKNFQEIGNRLESARTEAAKASREAKKVEPFLKLTNKETEDLFKIAFRNYVDLVTVADRKAGLLIQVNSILLSVVIAFTIRHIEKAPLYLIPISILLVSALVTILNAILASMPQQQTLKDAPLESSKSFFFGSFDRVDPDFKNTKWEDYEAVVAKMINGDKNKVFNEIIKETFQVRRILARKFGRLAIAYMVFISGLGAGIAAFIIVALIMR